jgi:hypothetical protein
MPSRVQALVEKGSHPGAKEGSYSWARLPIYKVGYREVKGMPSVETA